MRAEQFKPFHKSVVAITGSARGPSKWKKGPSVPKEQVANPSVVSPISLNIHLDSVMEVEPPLEHVFFGFTSSHACLALNRSLEKELVIDGLSKGVAKLGRVAQEVVYDHSLHPNPRQVLGNSARAQGNGVDQVDRNPLRDLSNTQNNPPKLASLRTWKNLSVRSIFTRKMQPTPLALAVDP